MTFFPLVYQMMNLWNATCQKIILKKMEKKHGVRKWITSIYFKRLRGENYQSGKLKKK